MKRINTVFTAIHILAAITMVILIAYVYFLPHFNVPPTVAFYVVLLYLPVFIVINGIWVLIRRARGGKQCSEPEQTVLDDSARLRLNRLTVFFISLNILLFAAAVIHTIISTANRGGSFLGDFWGILTNNVIAYSIPAVIINDVWVVVYMNMKERLGEKCRK